MITWDRVQWPSVVNTAMNVSFLRRNLLHRIHNEPFKKIFQNKIFLGEHKLN